MADFGTPYCVLGQDDFRIQLTYYPSAAVPITYLLPMSFPGANQLSNLPDMVECGPFRYLGTQGTY